MQPGSLPASDVRVGYVRFEPARPAYLSASLRPSSSRNVGVSEIDASTADETAWLRFLDGRETRTPAMIQFSRKAYGLCIAT